MYVRQQSDIDGDALEEAMDRSSQNDSGVPMFNRDSDRILMYTQGKTGSSVLQVALGKLGEGGEKIPWFGNIQNEYPNNIKTHQHQMAKDFLEKTSAKCRVWVVLSVRHVLAKRRLRRDHSI